MGKAAMIYYFALTLINTVLLVIIYRVVLGYGYGYKKEGKKEMTQEEIEKLLRSLDERLSRMEEELKLKDRLEARYNEAQEELFFCPNEVYNEKKEI